LTPDYAMSAANTPYLGRRPPYRSLEEAGRLERIQRAFLSASEAFPPEIAPSHIRTSVSKYENEMSAASERSVCCCCGRLIAAGDICEVDDEADFSLAPRHSLDHCGHQGNSWGFCTPCHTALRRGKIPKFSALNLVNVTCASTIQLR
jgi:hypothetical protein